MLRSCYRKLMQIILANLKHLSLDNCKALNKNGKLNSAHDLPALAECSTDRTCSLHGRTDHTLHTLLLFSSQWYKLVDTFFLYVLSSRENSAKSPPKDGGSNRKKYSIHLALTLSTNKGNNNKKNNMYMYTVYCVVHVINPN